MFFFSFLNTIKAKHNLNEHESMGVNMSAAIVTKRKPISINWVYCCTWYHPHKHHLLHPCSSM